MESIVIISIVIIISSSIFSIYLVRKKQKTAQAFSEEYFSGMIPYDGLEIPILRSYSGLKAIAPWVMSSNYMAPRLIFFPDRVTYRVLFKRTDPYQAIESVRAFRSKYFNKLRFIFYDRSDYFTAVFWNEKTLDLVLSLLADKGILPDEKSRL